MKVKIFSIVALFGASLMVCAPNTSFASSDGSGLQISGSGDIVGKAGSAGPGVGSQLTMREAEVALFSPIDTTFDGTVSLAAHYEDGALFFESHEVFISSSKLISRSRFRLGQFFLGVGILNSTHRHDWPFVSAPKVHIDFFDDEGVIDTGLEYSYLLPLSFYLELRVGLTSGWVFGHTHNAGEVPKFPTHYVRLESFLSFGDQDGLKYGLNYLGRKANDGQRLHLLGLDFKAKWKKDSALKFLLQSETWYRRLGYSGQEQSQEIGTYFYPQYGLSSHVFLGWRLDAYTLLSLRDVFGNKISNGTFALVPTLTYKPSEFVKFSLAYTLETEAREGRSANTEMALELQTTFILGAHPAHEF